MDVTYEMHEPTIKPDRSWNKYYPLGAVIFFVAFLIARSIRHGLDANAVGIALMLSLLLLLLNWICDLGKKWKFKPEGIAIACFFLLVLGRGAYNVTRLVHESETIWPAVEHAAMILGCSALLAVFFLPLLCLKVRKRKRWTT